MNGLSLRIEDALLERNINVGFHGRINYTSGLRKVYHSGLRVKPDQHGRMVGIVAQRSGGEGKEKRGLLHKLLGPTGVMVEPLSAKLFDPSLQVGFSMFQHLAMLGVPAALKLIHDVSER